MGLSAGKNGRRCCQHILDLTAVISDVIAEGVMEDALHGGRPVYLRPGMCWTAVVNLMLVYAPVTFVSRSCRMPTTWSASMCERYTMSIDFFCSRKAANAGATCCV